MDNQVYMLTNQTIFTDILINGVLFMGLIDNGERINLILEKEIITPAIIKQNKIIKINLIAIQRAQIIQLVKDINKKFNRKLTKLEHQQFMKKVSKKIERKLNHEDRNLINSRLIGGQTIEARNKDIKSKGGIVFTYKEGIGMARVLEARVLEKGEKPE